MIIRRATPRATSSILRSISKPTSSSIPSRCLHQQSSAPRIPPPTPFVPDPQTFLTLIGRNLSQHASKIPSWEALFSLTSTQLRELGIEPPRSRRYLLRWREKFRNGQYGIGGDAKTVVDGAAYLRVVEVPIVASVDNNTTTTTTSSSGAPTLSKTPATATRTPGTRKMVLNVRPDEATAASAAAADTLAAASAATTTTSATPLRQPHHQTPTPTVHLPTIAGVKLLGARTISGPHVQPVKRTSTSKGDGGLARIVRQEGLWEERRGHKIDGGERRKAERRAKRRSEERKAGRS